MPRPPKPWFRRGRGWYTTVRGHQVKLADPPRDRNRQAALEAFHRLMLREGTGEPNAAIRVDQLCFVFLEHAARTLQPVTAGRYKDHLQQFVDRHGAMAARDVRPLHVTRWLAEQAWGPTTKANAVAAIKRAFRWARRQGITETDPLADLERPQAQARHAVVTEDQARQVLDFWPEGDPFRDFLVVLFDTGARPGEVAAVTAAQVDLERGVWIMERHKTASKTRRARVVYLTKRAMVICRRFVLARPEGPLFRNERGRPWTRNAMACRFRALRAKTGLGKQATAYAFRHAFATEALSKGIPIATVSELLGHRDTLMVSRTYSHLHERAEHLRDSAQAVRGPAPSATAPTPADPPVERGRGPGNPRGRRRRSG